VNTLRLSGHDMLCLKVQGKSGSVFSIHMQMGSGKIVDSKVGHDRLDRVTVSVSVSVSASARKSKNCRLPDMLPI